jgi:hypothetical protein
MNRNVENICSKYSQSPFPRKKLNKTAKVGRPTVATATTQNAPVLSTVIEISPVVYQSLLMNDGSLNALREVLLLCVLLCGKQNYLQNPDRIR